MLLLSLLISKWRCGPVEFPVDPTSAILSPCFTLSPSFTSSLLQWAYLVKISPFVISKCFPYSPSSDDTVTVPEIEA